MAQDTTTDLRDRRTLDAHSEEDPKPIVNYTIGMILTFVILALLAIFVAGIYFSSSQPSRGGDGGQSEQRANP